MDNNMPILPLAPVERIIRKAGADRVSESAGIELAKTLEEFGTKVSIEAYALAKHAGRTTIREEDIRLAASKVREAFG